MIKLSVVSEQHLFENIKINSNFKDFERFNFNIGYIYLCMFFMRILRIEIVSDQKRSRFKIYKNVFSYKI